MAQIELARGPRGRDSMAMPPAYEVEQKRDSRLDPVTQDGKSNAEGMLTRLKELSAIMNRETTNGRERREKAADIRENVAPYAQILAEQIATNTGLPRENRVLALQIIGQLGKAAAAGRSSVEHIANRGFEKDEAVRDEARRVLKLLPEAPPFRMLQGVRRG